MADEEELHRSSTSPSATDETDVCVVDCIGAGLVNLGNTCYLNAVLQCLIHTVPLIETIQSFGHKPCCLSEDAEFCSLCALGHLMVLCQRSTNKSISPDLFAENLSNISPLFKRYQQEDAHEFLHGLLDSLDGSSRKLCSAETFSLSDTSIVRQTFGGRLMSVVRCSDCGHCSETFDPILDLSLEIDSVDNLHDALASFTKVERVDDPETRFTCEGCKSQVSVEKQLKLDQVPTVIVLHLKRFKNDGSFLDKIDTHVSYPKELNLQPFVRSQDAMDVKYDLYAFVVHSGWSSCSGHYFCFLRSSADVWHKMDDSMVYKVSEDEVSKQQAYILFYIKKGSSPWFSSSIRTPEFHAFPMPEPKTSPLSVLGCPEPFHSPVCDEETLSESSMEALACGESDICADDRSSQIPVNKLEVDKPSSVKIVEPCLSESAANAVTDTELAQFTEKSHRSISQNEWITDLFSDETLDDERENDYVLPLAVKPTKPPKRFQPCNRMNESVNRQLRQMNGSRRQALVSCLPSSFQTINLEPSTKKKRSQREPLTDGDNRSRPTLKTR